MGKKKILLLFMLISSSLVSCTYTRAINSSEIIDPPTKNFIKVYKELTLTRCLKKNQSNKTKKASVPKCDTKVAYSTGSGLIIDLVPNTVVALTAGHVCSSTDSFIKEDKKYNYSWEEKLTVLDYRSKFYNASAILATQATSNSADLCTIKIERLKKNHLFKNIKLSRRTPKEAESVYYIGAPSGIYHPPTALIVKGNYNGHISDYSALLTIKAAPGASGSVIMSLDHKIYGVLFAVHPSFDHATISTSYDATKAFLIKTRKILTKQKITQK